MRLGLFGGTFDPIHVGHLILAESCREACALDRVWFVVTATPPHKRGERTEVAHRLEMARIATAGHAAFEVSEIEAHSPDPTYSFQTLERLAADRPDDELFFLIGADSLVDLSTWRNPARIAELATIVVVDRPGLGPGAQATLQPPDLGPHARPFQFVTMPQIGISSTDIRRRVGDGLSVRYQIPRGVEAYIQAQKLYRPDLPGPDADAAGG
jgi:nicotinate-nucleotide adenylyltransferase